MMNNYVIYRQDNGEILRSVSCDLYLAQAQLGAGEALTPGRGSWVTHRVVDGVVVELQAPRVPPSPSHVWSSASASWSDPRSLQQAKADKWEQIKDERTRRLTGTFDHGGHTYDIDPVNLTGAALDAQIAIAANETAWEQTWVLHDNTVVTLTAEQMIAAARACKAAVSNLWATSQYLRGLIYADPPPENFEAITWP
jgi:hypothetical protein